MTVEAWNGENATARLLAIQQAIPPVDLKSPKDRTVDIEIFHQLSQVVSEALVDPSKHDPALHALAWAEEWVVWRRCYGWGSVTCDYLHRHWAVHVRRNPDFSPCNAIKVNRLGFLIGFAGRSDAEDALMVALLAELKADGIDTGWEPVARRSLDTEDLSLFRKMQNGTPFKPRRRI